MGKTIADYAYGALSLAATRLGGFLLGMLCAHRLSSEALGLYGLFRSNLDFLINTSTSPLTQLISRDVARAEGRGSGAWPAALKLALPVVGAFLAAVGGLWWALAAGYVPGLQASEALSPVLLPGLGVIWLAQAALLLDGAMRGLGLFRARVVCALGQSMVVVVAAWFLLEPFEVMGVAYAMLAGFGVLFASSAYVLIRAYKTANHVSKENATAASGAWGLAIPILAAGALQAAVVPWVNNRLAAGPGGWIETGDFFRCWWLYSLAILPAGIFGTVFLTYASRASSEEAERFWSQAFKHLRAALLATWLTAVPLLVLAPWILKWAMNREDEWVTRGALIMIVCGATRSVAVFFNQVYVAQGRSWAYLLCNATMAGITAGLCVALGSAWGAIGVCAAYLGGHAAGILAMVYCARKDLPRSLAAQVRSLFYRCCAAFLGLFAISVVYPRPWALGLAGVAILILFKDGWPLLKPGARTKAR
ncbi:MAG: hypothetical protein HS116_09450 [Planctomycetes bacterium]|nr:hypothetical protein [Planctomycetota bacterium]